MTKNTRLTSNGIRLAFLALAIAGSGSANAATVNAASTSTIIAPINITKAIDLAFGSFAAGTSAGTVTLTPGGGRTVDGGVSVIASSTATAAKFDVTGQAGLTYSISVTGTALSDGAGGSMAFTPVSDLTGGTTTSGNVTVGTLSAGGTQSIFVGGVLSVGISQTPGNYTGSVTALVNYN